LSLFVLEGNGGKFGKDHEQDHELSRTVLRQRLDDILYLVKLDYILSILASSCVVDTFIKLISQILTVTQVLMAVEFGVMTSALGETYEAIMLGNSVQYVPMI